MKWTIYKSIFTFKISKKICHYSVTLDFCLIHFDCPPPLVALLHALGRPKGVITICFTSTRQRKRNYITFLQKLLDRIIYIFFYEKMKAFKGIKAMFCVRDDVFGMPKRRL